MKIEAHPQLKLNQLSDAEQEAIETDCVSFLVELCCQINLQEVKILFVVGPVLAANLQQNHLSILPLVQGWPSRMQLFAWFHAALFHKPCFFYQQLGSSQNLPVAMLVL